MHPMPEYIIDFHNHCNVDPIDVLSYSAFDLVDLAVKRGIDAFAITPHRDVFYQPEAQAYAASKGKLLIAGVEKKIENFEVLILNVTPADIPEKCLFEDLRKLRQERRDDILVIAPHPFYPHKSCVGPRLDQYADCFDAIEYSHFYFLGWNPNEEAVAWANAYQKPIIANSDAHTLSMFGNNKSTVICENLTTRDIFDAIRAGNVIADPQGASLLKALQFLFRVEIYQKIARLLRKRCHKKNG